MKTKKQFCSWLKLKLENAANAAARGTSQPDAVKVTDMVERVRTIYAEALAHSRSITGR